MDRLELEVRHMLLMLAPPFYEGWKDEIERKAKHLEAADPDFSGLWERIKTEVRTRGWHKASSVQQQSSTSSERPAEQPGMATAEPKPAATRTTRPRESTGPRPTSSPEG